MRYLDDYRRDGYAVVAGVFPPGEVAELAREMDRLKAEASIHPTSYRHGNVLYVIQSDPARGRLLRFLQWPSHLSPVMERYRTDRRLFELLAPLLGRDIKQVINQIIWKAPGDPRTQYGYHQDSRFRRPAAAYRNLADAFVQAAIAVDPYGPGNGGMRVLAGSHRLGSVDLPIGGSVYEQACDASGLADLGLDTSCLVDLRMEPGDVALWHPHTIHGSGPNSGRADRRVYLNGYVRAADCDRGAWAFRDGRPVPLGEPVLIQYEDLHSRPEPHYLDGAPHPYLGGH